MATLRPTYLRGPGKLHRDFGALSLALTNAEGTSSPIDVRVMSMGQIWVAAGITGITWYGCDTETGTFKLIQDAGASGVQTVTADKYNQIPAVVMSHGFIKAVGSAAGAAILSGKG